VSARDVAGAAGLAVAFIAGLFALATLCAAIVAWTTLVLRFLGVPS
jgi:hypothetical protein